MYCKTMYISIDKISGVGNGQRPFIVAKNIRDFGF